MIIITETPEPSRDFSVKLGRPGPLVMSFSKVMLCRSTADRKYMTSLKDQDSFPRSAGRDFGVLLSWIQRTLVVYLLVNRNIANIVDFFVSWPAFSLIESICCLLKVTGYCFWMCFLCFCRVTRLHIFVDSHVFLPLLAPCESCGTWG